MLLRRMGALELFVFCGLAFSHVQGHSQFTCEPIMVPRCMGMAYNMTFFPNMMDHYDQYIAAVRLEPFLPLLNLNCSPDVHRFLCRAFVPPCTEQVHVIPPCRRLCKKVFMDCEQLMETFGITWPEELNCERLEDCDDALLSVSSLIPEVEEKQKLSEQVQRDYGFWCPQHLKTPNRQHYKFLGVNQCAPPCPNMYLSKDELDLAKSVIGIVSIICLCATLFTFLTFLIDVRRFRYPERPIIFYSVCYSMVALIYFIGFLLGNSTACNKADEKLEIGDTVVLGSQNKACTVLFMLLYFSTIAGTVWWVILTITWFLAAGQKWSCEAIEQKSMWFHSVAWGIPGILTVMLLALSKVEGDNISGVCFVGFYDLDAARYFVLVPLCLCVIIGLSLLLAGIISLNHVRQVIQHDERNQEKLKKFMIRIGVFSCLYLVPLVILLGCYVFEQVYRTTWEITWFSDHCEEYHIPCPYQVKTLARPGLSLFLIKYMMTLIVGISAVFWVGSRKTCSEWANFFNRSRKRDPIKESRRVLQESCEFFLKHNSQMKHKKHHKSSSHKLKVISKSMGTSTGVKANHGISAVTITNHDFLSQEACVEMKNTPETSVRDMKNLETCSQNVNDDRGEHSSQAPSASEVPTLQTENKSKTGNANKLSSLSGSVQLMAEARVPVASEFTETPHLHASLSLLPTFSRPGSSKGSVSMPGKFASATGKNQDPGNNASSA
ncbi:frizzled-6 [Rhinatrema bivittatum]|uniref:frizzled-6 n=1 Tax=Rhinatrema bivittatum TaxID=194408 RepID=UPI00112B0433|nr:frizzled-6 [Rhinatrema bivittatum]XP_029447714.1 frizzled-6 [Rhinatrema bivittatum]